MVIAAHDLPTAGLAAVYMIATIRAAVRTEEADLRERFGSTYDEYRASTAEPMERRFSLARAMRNREWRAMTGVAVGFGLLALKLVQLL